VWDEFIDYETGAATLDINSLRRHILYPQQLRLLRDVVPILECNEGNTLTAISYISLICDSIPHKCENFKQRSMVGKLFLVRNKVNRVILVTK
jgi:hypothetical protein